MSGTGNPVNWWNDNAIQFPRLLTEIAATQDNLDFDALCASMDLELVDLASLFERAQQVWDGRTVCPECETRMLVRSVGLLPTCPGCDWTGWTTDTDATISLPYDFSNQRREGRYPNGRCPACGLGLDDERRCQTADGCANYGRIMK